MHCVGRIWRYPGQASATELEDTAIAGRGLRHGRRHGGRASPGSKLGRR